jgi:hypothetical protein
LLSAQRQQSLQVRLAQVQRQLAQIVVALDMMSKAQNWTSSSCLRECRASKSETPSTPGTTASPSSTNRL